MLLARARCQIRGWESIAAPHSSVTCPGSTSPLQQPDPGRMLVATCPDHRKRPASLDTSHPTPLILRYRVACQKNRSFARLRVRERWCSYECSRLRQEKVPVDRTEVAQLKIGDIPQGEPRPRHAGAGRASLQGGQDAPHDVEPEV